MEKEKLIIFDTTLRDGEQCPGASMNSKDKLKIAKMLEELRIDVIEAGFPISSLEDFQAIENICKNVKNSRIAVLARAVDADLDSAKDAIKHANMARIHTFIATSRIHMHHKLRMQPDEVLSRAEYAVKKARNYCDDVEFSAEDAGRSDFDFLCKIVELAIKSGASTINIPDTVGYTLPEQYGTNLKRLIEAVPNSDKAIFSTHCHNDLGLAVANSLSGVLNGARQVECTINGIGERAGNAAMEEIVMAIKVRKDIFPCDTNIDTTKIVKASKMLAETINFPVQYNKAIVGQNAFAHESGIHQAGVLKSAETYEIMKPEDVGWTSECIVLGKHSGRHALKAKFIALGLELRDEQQLDNAFKLFKTIAAKQQKITNEDLNRIYNESQEQQQ